MYRDGPALEGGQLDLKRKNDDSELIQQQKRPRTESSPVSDWCSPMGLRCRRLASIIIPLSPRTIHFPGHLPTAVTIGLSATRSDGHNMVLKMSRGKCEVADEAQSAGK